MGVLPQRYSAPIDKRLRRSGARRPGSGFPSGPVTGDLFYETDTKILWVWDGAAWQNVSAGGGGFTSPGIELYNPSSTPYIDWHRAANPAGDGGADFNMRLINDANNVLRISSASGVDTATGGRLHVGNAWMGSSPPHGAAGWAGFGHQNRLASNDYQFLANSNGDVIVNSTTQVRLFFNGATERININGTCVDVLGGLLAMNDGVIRWRQSSDSNHRTEYQGGVDAVNHTMNSNIRFASTSQYVAQITVAGEIIARLQDGNSRTRLGSWPGNGIFGGLFNEIRLGQNGGHYMHMASASDDNTFITCNSGGSSGAGTVHFRLGNNGSTVMTVGNNNGGVSANLNICMALPQIGGNGMIWAAASGQVGHNGSSARYKKNLRRLKDTPEPDAGEDSPIFKMTPRRFNWRQWSKESPIGMVNGDEYNERFPNGVAGLIAEEVFEIAPDAVVWKAAKPEWHWKEGDAMPETGEDGNPVIYKPAEEEEITGLDTDRLLAYLVDAIQHTKEKSDHHKEEIKLLKEEIKNLKKAK